LRTADFESAASTNSATRALEVESLMFNVEGCIKQAQNYYGRTLNLKL